MRNPDLRLEKIWRGALENNIINFTVAIRKGMPLKYGRCPGVTIWKKSDYVDYILDPSYDQIIVGFNRTRHQINRMVRRHKNHLGGTPDPGEKVICLNNNRNLGLYNGMTLEVIKADIQGKYVVLDLYSEEGRRIKNIPALGRQFGRNKLDDVQEELVRGTMLFDFAEAITCHKSQGSEWPKVLILEEIYSGWNSRRWLYTAVTRASEHVTLLI